jgi:DNA gyrase subunit A
MLFSNSDLPPRASRDSDHPRELEDKQARAPDWHPAQGRGEPLKIVKNELEEISSKAATSATSIVDGERPNNDDFIVDEDNVVIVSRDGWVKRQKDVKDLSTTRLR